MLSPSHASCAVRRRDEALTGAPAGQPLSRERLWNRVPTPSPRWKAIRVGARAQAPTRPGVVVDPGMRGNSLHGNREISCLAAGRTPSGPHREGEEP